MKKILLLGLFVLFLSGCDVEYNLVVDDMNDKIYNEKILINSESYELIQSAYDNVWPTNAYNDGMFNSESPEKIPGVEYYNVNSYKKNNHFFIDYRYQFPSGKFSKSNGVNSAFNQFSKKYNPDLNITTIDSGVFNYEKFSQLDNLKITVQINNVVKKHNASIANENEYIWNFSNEELKTARITLSYEGGGTPNVKDPIEEEVSKDNRFMIALIVIGLFIIFIIGAIILNVKKKNQIGR